jgi:hypothetical protein
MCDITGEISVQNAVAGVAAVEGSVHKTVNREQGTGKYVGAPFVQNDRLSFFTNSRDRTLAQAVSIAAVVAVASAADRRTG